MTAALIAEALAVGLQYTTDDGVWYDGGGKRRPPRHLLVAPVGVRVVDTSSDRDEALRMAADWPDCSVYYRADVVDAALAHLAERAERAEARTKEAERSAGRLQRRVNALCAALERLAKDWKFKKNSGGYQGFAQRALAFDGRRFSGLLTPELLAEEEADRG